MPLEAAAPTLIERPRTIAYHASISKDGRNTLRDQMGLNLEQFDEFVVLLSSPLSCRCVRTNYGARRALYKKRLTCS